MKLTTPSYPATIVNHITQPIREDVINPKTNASNINKDGMIPHCSNPKCPSYDIIKGYGKCLNFYNKKEMLWSCYICHVPCFNPTWVMRSIKYTHREKRSASRSLTRDELLHLIDKIDKKNSLALRDKALISILYITGARIEEIVGMKDYDKNYIVFPLKRSQIDYEYDNKNFALIKGMPVLKRRSKEIVDIDRKTVLKTPIRNVPVDTVFESKFWEHIIHYLNQFDIKKKQKENTGLKTNDYLFPITACRAWQIVFKHTTYFCHLMRHIRASHLVEHYGFQDQELRAFFGWSNSAPASTYVHLDDSLIMMKMRQRGLSK